MTHYEFKPDDEGRYPMVSDFGRVCLWFGNDAGTRRTIKPHRGTPYARAGLQLVGGSSASLGVASLVLNAFVGKPDEGYTAVRVSADRFAPP